jgi:alpha-N-acetylglucosaminidase
MQKYFPTSTWILQDWGTNPENALLKELQKDKTLIVELKGESQSSWKKTDAFGRLPWIW